MTKADIVSEIAKKAGISKAKAEIALGAFVSTVQTAVKKGDKVALVGFGTFDLVSRASRKGRNPKTGAEIKIKASKSPRFRAGKAFKSFVNGGK